MNQTKIESDIGFVRLPNGLRLRYRRMGADGPTIVLLHGWPQTGHAWRLVMPTLASSGYVALAPDLRGCGDSDKPVNGYDALTRMEDVRALVSALGCGDNPLYVAGHGEGGAGVALAYAQTYSGEVAAAAVLSAFPGQPADWHTGFHQTPDLPELLIGSHLEAYIRHFFRAWSHDPQMLPENDLAVYVRALSEPGALRASLASFRVPSFVFHGENAVPLLTLLGESDPRFDICAIQSGERRVTIPRGGHWLPEERPDPVAAALLTFFRDNPLAPNSGGI